MPPLQPDPWLEQNIEHVQTLSIALQNHLKNYLNRSKQQFTPQSFANQQTIKAKLEFLPALEILRQNLKLTPFEHDILLLGITAVLLPDFNGLCASAEINQKVAAPTFRLAMTISAQSHWSATKPLAPLRYWQLITLDSSRSLLQSAFLIDECILHYCLGESYQDPYLEPYFQPVSFVPNPVPFSPSQTKIISELSVLWNHSQPITPIYQLLTQQPSIALALAHSACLNCQVPLYQTSISQLAEAQDELNILKCRWQRSYQLTGSILVVDGEDLNSENLTYVKLFKALIEKWSVPLLIIKAERINNTKYPIQIIDLPTSSTHEQFQQWASIFSDQKHHPGLNFIETLTNQFRFNPIQIQTAAQQSLQQYYLTASEAEVASEQLQALLWESCRQQARPRLDTLAKRIETLESWEDLVLPDISHQMLWDLLVTIKYQKKVYADWGMADKSNRGFGVTALFVGASGTGKTMAANVIAQKLNLDLYRIDLSATVSKYIGETEKNLKQIFDAAESGGVVLLFDEADAIFGKRSPVNDSRDRYANLEVSYLLQRLETYNGLAILTTNLKESIDPAFLRRLQFVVRFPFPDEAQRRRIWQRVYPETVPTENLDFKKLAKLNVAGGNIRNIALNGAFKAAAAGTGVTMAHLLAATEGEFRKLEQPLPSREVADWLTPDEPQQAITEAMFSLDGVHWEDAMITEEELAEWRRKEQEEIAELKRQEREGDF